MALEKNAALIICGLLISEAWQVLFISLPAAAEENYLNLGINQYNHGKYAEALNSFGAAQPQNAENPTYHYYMANTYVRLNQNVEAIREYKLARDLAAGSQISSYCDAALKTLESVESKTNKANPQKITASANENASVTTNNKNWHRPELIMFSAGGPADESTEELFVSLYQRFGEQISFRRSPLKTNNPKLAQLVYNLQITKTPAVLLFDDQGKISKSYYVGIAQDQLTRDVAALADDVINSKYEKLTNSQENRLMRFRNEQLSDACIHIRQAENTLKNNLQALDDDIAEKNLTLSSSVRTRYSDNSAIQVARQLIAEDQRKEQILKKNFARDRSEWLAQAEMRIESMENSH